MRSEITRRQFSDNHQSYFSYKYACWANNHRGWQKMKKLNRKVFKKRFRKETTIRINKEMEELYHDKY